ncbi:hypothetical protein GGTG_00877 [Gaeumannomyces tritici R3-111a-1]|uniref:Uncharacterized protein n=1 Tax=Gaeumannomyces tritici (strain R3-111a-1) TaxID=644352 RepID=J3NHZ1_GAET3|nr:hypothetical protein GGTG_00877 [Gaeumannomyces tritici R3-111a-1]EJT80884.1 hypothetical protein GGTG_00877 [Gaeumannomyces tritici R3-111a-1]
MSPMIGSFFGKDLQEKTGRATEQREAREKDSAAKKSHSRTHLSAISWLIGRDSIRCRWCYLKYSPEPAVGVESPLT